MYSLFWIWNIHKSYIPVLVSLVQYCIEMIQCPVITKNILKTKQCVSEIVECDLPGSMIPSYDIGTTVLGTYCKLYS